MKQEYPSRKKGPCQFLLLLIFQQQLPSQAEVFPQRDKNFQVFRQLVQVLIVQETLRR